MGIKRNLQQQQELNNVGLQVVKKTRTKNKPYNDIELDNWRDYNHIDVGTMWNFASRDKSSRHSYDYHGNYIPQIATQLYERFTKQGDVILDMFLGSGTSAIEAINMGRRCVGVEIKKDMVDYVSEKFTRKELNKAVKIINGDSSSDVITTHIKATLKGLEEDFAQFLVLHPPYADIIKFSDLENDLSNYAKTEDFIDQFKNVAKNGYDCLEKGRFAALIIGDKYAGGEIISLSSLCMEAMKEVGFKHKATIVKNIEGNEKAKGKTANLWRYRALAGGFFIFKHEYIYLFQKVK